jgi:hypothetical protein
LKIQVKGARKGGFSTTSKIKREEKGKEREKKV